MTKKRFVLTGIVAALMTSTGLSSATSQEKMYDGMTIRWLIPSGHNSRILKAHQEEAKEVLGIHLEPIEVNENQLFETAMSNWVTGSVDYCIVTTLAAWNGDFMAGGFIRPLDGMLAESEYAQEAVEDMIEEFKVYATQWEGQQYAFAQDGNVTNLYYRKDVLENPEIRSGFEDAKGYEMPVPPTTVKELVDVSEYLADTDWDGDGETEHGYAQTWHVPWRTFLPFYGSVTGGDLLFDDAMNPKINTPEVAEMLDHMRRLVNAGPTGASSYDYVEGPASFINGDVALTWFWGDVAKLIYEPGWAGDPQNVGMHWKDQIGYGLMPGYEVDGEVYNYNELSGKIVGIPESCENPEAALAALAFVSHPDRSIKTVDSTATGSDPFSKSHLALPAEDWEVEIDQEYLDLIPRLMANGYPAPPLPGGQEYLEAIDRHVSGFLVNEDASAEATLAAIEQDWNRITDQRGREDQIEIWSRFIKQLRDLGFEIKG